ncbi:unnamed protein product [Rangifer tarandus platyrhynchus]|uniref:Uncharacterized protein n=1 Tax=Rangifer tarandus platyrhynchus TaxID=3082113 RepID=A0AC59ZGZ2_RANTA
MLTPPRVFASAVSSAFNTLPRGPHVAGSGAALSLEAPAHLCDSAPRLLPPWVSASPRAALPPPRSSLGVKLLTLLLVQHSAALVQSAGALCAAPNLTASPQETGRTLKPIVETAAACWGPRGPGIAVGSMTPQGMVLRQPQGSLRGLAGAPAGLACRRGHTALMVKYHSQALRGCGRGLSCRLRGFESSSSPHCVASRTSLTFPDFTSWLCNAEAGLCGL